MIPVANEAYKWIFWCWCIFQMRSICLCPWTIHIWMMYYSYCAVAWTTGWNSIESQFMILSPVAVLTRDSATTHSFFDLHMTTATILIEKSIRIMKLKIVIIPASTKYKDRASEILKNMTILKCITKLRMLKNVFVFEIVHLSYRLKPHLIM